MKRGISADPENGFQRDEDRLRALLRLKRLERPPAQFWSGFERDLQRELFRSARRGRLGNGAWILAPVFALALALVVVSLWRQPDHLSGAIVEGSVNPVVTTPEAGAPWADEEWSGTRFVANAWVPHREESVYVVSNVLGVDVRAQGSAEVSYVSDRWSRDGTIGNALSLHP